MSAFLTRLSCICLLLLFALQLKAEEPSADSLLLDSLSQTIEDTQKITQQRSVMFKKAMPSADDKPYSLGTPYHAIRTFQQYLNRSNPRPDSAALALYVKNPFSIQSMELATMLKQYLDSRGHVLDPEDFSRDSNYIDTLIKKGQYVFFPFPDDEPEIYLTRIGKDWLFSRSTVEKIPDLHARAFPFGSMEWIPDGMRKNFGALQIWQWLGIVIFLIAGFLIYKALIFLLRLLMYQVVLRFVFENMPRGPLTKTARPFSFLIVTILLSQYVAALQLPANFNRTIYLILDVCGPVFAVLVFYNAVEILGYLMQLRAAKTKNTLDDQLVPLVTKALKGVVIIVGIIFVLENLEVNVTTLLAGLSIGGLALALAAQDTVKNFFGSLMIFLDRPFQVGDIIQSNGIEGTVEEVSVRSTRIRTFTNSLVSIPNSKLADSAVDNLGMRRMRRFRAMIYVPFHTSPELLEAYVSGLRLIARNHPKVFQPEVDIHLNEISHTAFGILVHIYFEVPAWTEELTHRQEFILAAIRLAQKLGVEFAYPVQNVNVYSNPAASATPAKREEFDAIINDFVNDWKDKLPPPQEKKD